ncbi:MAG: helix-turn-helix domain-containing protein [Clostridia bacterium]|nr:helix-turn-helix domain-containing protein [Clostridia bacterium]
MKDTKERILLASLELFARYGYDAASVSRIAEAVGLTKGALYRHFEDKAAILRAILARMEADDAAFAGRFALPMGEAPDSSTERAPSGGTLDFSAERDADAAALVAFARAMFAYWTEDAFASAFRRMLTVSQYTSPEMRALYRQYLADEPLAYCEDILKAAGHADARLKALRLFAPMTFLYALYDGEADHAETLRLADAHFSSMARELCSGFTV